ncbi:MAG: HAMP domain-containing histidine kinase, partial [Anaerolineales bacterium]|nr:HAMP domain-containing histidine kinase [Anaerolineales bacterium]
QVVYSEDPTITAGDTVSGNRLDSAIPIEVNDRVVALVLFGETNTQPETITDSPEIQFLDGVNRTVRFGVLGAVMLALLLGTLLARTISRPVQEMTAATERVAQGDLGHQVPVRTKDEIGKLAASFNKMSADLAQSTRLRRQMTADIAHDLRTPLSIILGYTEALSDGKMAADADILHVMHDKAKQLQRLVEDLRTLALADAGELSLIRRLVEPQMMLEHTALAHMVQAEAQNVSLHVEVDPDTPTIYVDRERMGQVLGNLVSNALRYTPNGGRITLGASSDGAQVTLRVADTGAGIAAEDLPHIFDRFYRVDKSRHNPSNESGLGLAIAKSIVQVHGGEITAVSDGPGYGTTFFIYLPITALIPNTTS